MMGLITGHNFLQAQIENLQQEGKTAEARKLVPEMDNAVAMFKAAKEMEAREEWQALVRQAEKGSL